MGLPTGGKNSKVNIGAFQGQMKRNIGKAKTKERLRRKLEERRAQREEASMSATLSQEDQIKLLEKQLAEARSQNENPKKNKKKKRRRKRKKSGDNKK